MYTEKLTYINKNNSKETFKQQHVWTCGTQSGFFSFFCEFMVSSIFIILFVLSSVFTLFSLMIAIACLVFISPCVVIMPCVFVCVRESYFLTLCNGTTWIFSIADYSFYKEDNDNKRKTRKKTSKVVLRTTTMEDIDLFVGSSNLRYWERSL